MKRVFHDWFVEMGVLGRLDAADQEEFDKLRRSDGDLQERIAALERSNLEILKDYPHWERRRGAPLAGDSRPTSKLQFRPSPLRWPLVAAAVLVFSISTLFFVMRWFLPSPDAPALREKGTVVAPPDFSLRLYRKTDNTVELLHDTDWARGGDWLQIAYYAPRPLYGIIFSLDGEGRATLHFPLESMPNERLQAGRWIYLSQGLKLDDAPGFEHFYLAASDFPFPLPGIIQEIEIWARKIGQDPKVPVPGKRASVRASFLLRKNI